MKKDIFNFGLSKKNNSKKVRPFDLKINIKNNNYPKYKSPTHSIEKMKNMNWKQVQRRFPNLNPMGDVDFDGTRNKFDCKPFDPARDGIGDVIKGVVGKISGAREKVRTFVKKYDKPSTKQQLKELRSEQKMKSMEEKIERAKTEGLKRTRKEKLELYKKQLELKKKLGKEERRTKPIKEIKEGFKKEYSKAGTVVRRLASRMEGQQSSGKKYSSPGRPPGTGKTRINPFTGQAIKIPAKQYYKLVKKYREAVRTRAESVSRQVDTGEIASMAKRGIEPQVAEQIVNRRQLAMALSQNQPLQAPQQQEVEQPITYVENERSVPTIDETGQIQQVYRQPQFQYGYNQPRVKFKRDLMTGRIIQDFEPPIERWQRPHRFQAGIV